MSSTPRCVHWRGFTLVEVLVSMVVIAIGLLGIAKMQALAFSSTGVASMRSLAAIEASSLAASMHADRAYWSSGVAATAPGFTITGTVISDPNMAQAAPCTVALAGGLNPPDCSPIVLAAYDVQAWAAVVNGLLPNPLTQVSCNNIVGQPVVCTITIVWSENTVAINTQGQSQATMQLPTYALSVEP